MTNQLSKDILLVILLSLVSIVCIATLPLNKYHINIISYLLLALFLPGYAFIVAIYPLKEDIKPYKRIFGSILISLFLTIILTFLARYKIFAIGTSRIFLIIAIITILMSIVAFYRKYRLKKHIEEKKIYHKRSSKQFSDTLKGDMKSRERHKDLIEKTENLKIYRTSHNSIKDLYLVIILTLISLAVLTNPLTNYLGNSIFYTLKPFLILLILLCGYALGAALIPLTKIGSSKRLFLTIIFGILIFTLFFFFLKLNTLNGLNIILISILSLFIGLMCIIACLRRMKIPKIKKDGSKYEKPNDQSEKSSSIDYEIPKAKKKTPKPYIEDVNKMEQPHPVDKTEKILVDKFEGQKHTKTPPRSLDLILVFFTTVICIGFVLTPKLNETMIGTILGILVILFLSGYSLVAALYPKKDDLESIERGSLSFGFSLMGLALGIVINDIKPIAISLTSIILLLSTFTIIMIIIAYIRRRRVPEEVKLDNKIRKSEISNEANSKKEETPISVSHEIINEKLASEKISKPRFVSIDLLLIFLTTLVAIIFIVNPKLNQTFIRTISGLLLILFIPGYSLIAALFPKKGDLDSIERAALSFGLSIAVTPLIGLALNYTPWGIRLTPILISLSAFTIIMVLIAYVRRRKIPEEEKFYVNFDGFSSSIKSMFKGESKTSKILSIILIISIFLAIGTTAYIIVKPNLGETFTEFYLLGPGGNASDYPTNLTVGQNASVIIGVVNHEHKTVEYHLVVTSNSAIMSEQNITLTNGNKTEIPYSFTANSNGTKKIEFLLYKLPDNTNIYRSLHLFVNVV